MFIQLHFSTPVCAVLIKFTMFRILQFVCLLPLGEHLFMQKMKFCSLYIIDL